MAKFGKLSVFLTALVMVVSTLVMVFTPAAAVQVISIGGPPSADEGVSADFPGTIDGYGTGNPTGYSIDDTLSEPWIDATGGTTKITSASYSSPKTVTITLPFDFNFWGVYYPAGSTIWVSSNAVMDFGTTTHSYKYNYDIPSTASNRPNNAAYIYWDAMSIRGSSSSFVCYDVDTATLWDETNDPDKVGHTYLAIEWHNMYCYSTSSNPGTVEIVLWDDDDIDMRYKDVSFSYSSVSNGKSATIGLENAAGTEAAKYCCNGNPNKVYNNDNLRYTWHEGGGTGYEWKVDGVSVGSGYVLSEPFTTTLSYTWPDGPAISTIELLVTYDGVLIGSTSRLVQVNNVAPLVYGDGTYAYHYAGDTHGYARSVYLGDKIYFHGHISDVAADTPEDWATQQWVEVTPGSEGVEWEVTPYTGEYVENWEYNYNVTFLRPGIYTVTVYVYDKDGGIGWGSDQRAPRYCIAMEHIRWQWEGAGHGLKILEATVKPADVQAGGMTLAYLKVLHDHPDPKVQVPLVKEDIQTLLPDGWELLDIYGPEWVNGGSTEILTAAVSIPPGTPVGEYSFLIEPLPYSKPNHWHETEGGIWCCRDDITNGYGQYYADPLVYDDIYVDAQYLKLTHNMQADSSDGGCVLIDDGTGWTLLTPLDGYVREVWALGAALDLPYGTYVPAFTYEYPGNYDPGDYPAMGIDYFDLSAYYGQQVDIILMFASWSSSGWWGWNISDISLVDHTGTNVFFDDFTNADNWDTDDKYGVIDYDEDDSGDCVDYWIDIVDPANDLNIDEDYPDYIKTLPYTFTFYGETYSQLSVTAYGYLVMDYPPYGSTTKYAVEFPVSTSYLKYMIAPFHGYLRPGKNSAYERGSVYALQIGSKLVVTYDDVRDSSSSTHFTFQVILDNSDNSIRFNYNHMHYGSSSYRATVGLNAGDGERYEQYYHQYYSTIIGTKPTDCTTILYTPGPMVKVSGWEIVDVVDGMITETPYGEYPDSWDTYLTLKDGVYLSGDYAALEFDHMYWLWGGDDLYVEISADNGANWDQVEAYGGYDVTETPGYPDSTVHAYIDLSDYLGETILVRFHLDADTYGHHDGWYIDNVEINTYEEDLIRIESATDPRPAMTISVVDKMKGDELAYYRHTQNAIREIVVLSLNLDNGMEDDGSLAAAVDAYTSCDTQAAHSIASAANAKGNSYGYWVHDGGYDYFFNPGKNGNGMAGLTGKEAMD